MLFIKNKTPSLINLVRLRNFGYYPFGIIKFNLPDLGEKIKQGTIKKFYVKQGDSVTQFQKIADVASDKQFTELTATDTGVIRNIFFKQEQVCQVGDLLLQIQVKDQNHQPASNTNKQTQNQATNNKNHEEIQSSQNSGNATTQILASPFVRNLIKKHGLDINSIKGSGERGRILEKDIQNIINKTATSPQPSKPQPQTKKQQHKPQIARQTHTTQRQSPAKSDLHNVSTITMNGYEKGMQKSMTESNTIPHLYFHEQLDITQIEKMRKALKQSNKKVTVMGILIKTFSLALKQFPKMNSLYHPDVNPYEYSIYPNHNISIAIDSPNGLVVPHIKNVNNINLIDIQHQLQRLRNLAKEAKLTGKQLQGGTVCLSNIGTIGGTHACPLILPPQVCIVAIGKLQSVPKYRGNQLVQRKVINVSFGCDHRVVDGATVARFSNAWKNLIENPYLSIAQMI